MSGSLGFSSFESFTKAGEKNVFKNMFGSNDDSDESDTNDDENELPSSTLVNGCADSRTDVNENSVPDVSFETYESLDSTLPFTVYLEQQKCKGIAHQLWPAAIYLSKFIEKNKQQITSSSICTNTNEVNVIELGAGCGLPALAAGTFISVFCP